MKLSSHTLFKGLTICCSLLLLSYLSSSALSSENYKIPFLLTPQNNIIVKATLNGQDTVSLMFHTAASALTLTTEAIGKMKNLHFNGADTVKSWGGAENSSRFSKGNLLQIGKQSWTNISLWENLNSGPGSGGKFGLELFPNKVIDINFDTGLITISKNLPSKTKHYEKLKLVLKDEMMFIDGQCNLGNERIQSRFLIHSGYSGSVLFDDKFTADHLLSEKLTITSERILKDSFGNILKTKKAIMPTLSIGKTDLNNISVGFFQGALGRQKMSIVGGDLIKRFNIIISANRETIYLKPNRLKDAPYSNI